MVTCELWFPVQFWWTCNIKEQFVLNEQQCTNIDQGAGSNENIKDSFLYKKKSVPRIYLSGRVFQLFLRPIMSLCTLRMKEEADTLSEKSPLWRYSTPPTAQVKFHITEHTVHKYILVQLYIQCTYGVTAFYHALSNTTCHQASDIFPKTSRACKWCQIVKSQHSAVLLFGVFNLSIIWWYSDIIW